MSLPHHTQFIIHQSPLYELYDFPTLETNLNNIAKFLTRKLKIPKKSIFLTQRNFIL